MKPNSKHQFIVDLLVAVKRSRRAMDVLMPGIGGLAIAAEDIANINHAFIECDKVLRMAKGAGIVVEVEGLPEGKS